MTKNINGKLVSKILLEELREYLKNKEINPQVVDISIGNDFGGKMYATMKQKTIQNETGIDFISKHFDRITEEDLINYIKSLNENSNITGIMLQLPLPDELNKRQRIILDSISPNKDIDGLTTQSFGKLACGEDSFYACTAWGIETLLKVYNVDLTSKKVAIINRSNIVGKPLTHLLLLDNAIPTICHSKVQDLKSITLDSDIVIAALNRKEFITADFIKDGAIVIDVGVHKNSEGKTVGDVDYNDVYNKASLITPPTGGVGPMTVAMLAYNSAKSVYHDEVNELLDNSIEKIKKLKLK